jgi:aldehyde:ferredoxin oxidoreductase
MTVKKQEMPAYDPRGVQGIGLNYATNNRGGCHVRGYTIAVEVLGNPTKMDPSITKGKTDLDIAFQNLTAAVDSSGACLFSTFGLGADELAEMLTALTGVSYTTPEFVKAGERIWNLERMWNLKAGLSAKDDTLPQRLLKDPIKTGPSKGNLSKLPEMLPEYYHLRGWDKNGIPGEENPLLLQIQPAKRLLAAKPPVRLFAEKLRPPDHLYQVGLLPFVQPLYFRPQGLHPGPEPLCPAG